MGTRSDGGVEGLTRATRSRGIGARAPVLLGCGALVGCGALLSTAPISGQIRTVTADLPFIAGENLAYHVSSSRFGRMGTARMTVQGPTRIDGREVLLLTMETRGRVLLVGYEDEARSWLDVRRMASIRYEKEERHPLGSRNEAVRVLLAEGRWEGRGDEGGPLQTDAPLDELSFIYFLRTLALDVGAEHTFARHFDMDRNPVRVRVLSRESLTVPAGTFEAVEVEMRVRDPRRFENGEEAVIRFHFTDDDRRIPLRIESTAPWVGTVVMTLESVSPPLPSDGIHRSARAP